MDGPARLLIPELGVSALDAAGQPFWDPEADAALFRALDNWPDVVLLSEPQHLVRFANYHPSPFSFRSQNAPA